MTKKVKLICYVLLAAIGLWCGIGFVRGYSAATRAQPKESVSEGEPAPPVPKTADRGRMMSYGMGLFAVIVLRGLLAAFDISRFMAQRVEEFVFDEKGEAAPDPEYEEAEKVWANGKPLEAIGLMRDYLKLHPREQYVALRIAEIYEKDLGNYLAAALEYEEVLKKRLPADRWGWAAIHLCNLYFKLGQEQKAYDLLRRLVKDFPDTPAAEKACKRLEQVDGASLEQLATESNVTPRTPAAP